jgi:hypothetical protein
MPSLCKESNCKKNASFNFLNEKIPVYCKSHMKNGMIITKKDNRICIHQDHENKEKAPRASFNFSNEKKPIYCQKHAMSGMINLNNKDNKCAGCKIKAPSYGKIDQKATHCSKCATIEMVDLVSNLCSYEDCRKNANYGNIGEKASRCKTHCEKDMIDVKSKKCKLCTKQPTFGIGGKIATHCLEHKTEEMKDCKHSKEICEKCDIRASYGLEKLPTHCTDHKTEQMKDLVSKMCKNCNEKQPVFGYSKENMVCIDCKEKDMKNIKHKMCQKCNEKQPTFNYKGIKPPIFCSGCSLDGMVDVINPRCKSCSLFVVNKKPHLCNYCNTTSTLRQKTKEMDVVNYLQLLGYNFIHNKSVGFVCGNYRPDIKIDANTHIVIVEIDEDQHNQYDHSCEMARMFNIFQSEGMRCVFLRFNPDVFKINGKTKKVYKDTRLKILATKIKDSMNNIPEDDLTIYKLFYDNTEDINTFKVDVDKKYMDLLNVIQKSL